MLEKKITLKVFPNESQNPNAPTHRWNNYTFKDDVMIKAGTTVDLTFWGNNKDDKGKPSPHLTISNPSMPKQNDGNNRGNYQQRSYGNNNFSKGQNFGNKQW